MAPGDDGRSGGGRGWGFHLHLAALGGFGRGRQGAQTGRTDEAPREIGEHDGSATLTAQIDIDAPVSKVWGLISDLNRMRSGAHRCRKMNLLGCCDLVPHAQPQPARTAVLADDVDHHRGYPGANWRFGSISLHSIWSTSLEPTDTGTRVTGRDTAGGVTAVSTAVTRPRSAAWTPSKELVGHEPVLARIKAAAEAASLRLSVRPRRFRLHRFQAPSLSSASSAPPTQPLLIPGPGI